MVAKPHATEPVAADAGLARTVRVTAAGEERLLLELDVTDGEGTRTIRVALPLSLAAELRAALAGQLALAEARRRAVAPAPEPPAVVAPPASDDESLPPVQFLSPEEGRALFDEQARRLLGLSGEEFLRRYDAGEFDAVYDDPGVGREVVHLSMLIPFARPHA